MFIGNEITNMMNSNIVLFGVLSWLMTYISAYASPIINIIINKIFTIIKINNRYDKDNAKKLIVYINDNAQFIEKYSYEYGNKMPYGLCISFSKCFIANIYLERNDFMGNTKVISYTGIKPNAKLKTTPLEIENTTEELTKEELDKYGLEVPKLINVIGKYNQVNEINIYFRPTDKQKTILDSIITGYNGIKCRINNNVYKVLVAGESGSGKSTLAKLLAGQLKSNLVYDYSIKKNNIDDFYSSNGNSNPLIIQVDEFDVYIKWMHENTINGIDITACSNNNSQNNNSEDNGELINNKQKYNMLMSEIINLKRNVIYIYTTNKPITWFSELDKSYIAPSRIDSIFEMTGNARDDANLHLA